MGLSVIGAGWGRTGTMSLKLALEQLGVGPCHHMGEVMGNAQQSEYWLSIANGEPVEWDDVFAGCNSACDWPSAHYWRELAAFYPNSKVILTVRPEDDWWNSYSRTIMTSLQKVDEGVDHPVFQFLYDISEKMFIKTADARYDDKEKLLAAYRDYEGIVRKHFAEEPDRLLVFNVKEGWEPLCTFLGFPVPNGEFPRTNSTEEFQNAQRRI